ncbi:MAG: galactose-1-phosphate uridylyltransferase [Thermodesulfobacteriota bacterium]
MPEFRLNLISREWVVLNAERARGPAEFRRGVTRSPKPSYLDSCPFCPGNEGAPENELYRVSDNGGWKIRVLKNKYPVLSMEGEPVRTMDGPMRMVSGVGLHEVIVESPLHDTSPAFFELTHMVKLLSIYRSRFNNAYLDKRVEHVIIFKNHGPASGTSIEHPHSQLVATPVVPARFRDRILAAMQYFDDTGKCIKCDMIEKERADSERVILETEHFITFIPFAALSPFHLWIFPKRHMAVFSGINEDEIKDLALHMKTILHKLHVGLDDPDYNYSISSSATRHSKSEFSHWYISIIPRLIETTGFELGSGIYVNPSMPEKNAEFLRAIEE